MTINARVTYRQRQAQETRDRIASAARGLFADRGYPATSIEAIADAAGIPVPTIYSAFGSKRAILEAIRRFWIADSDVEDLYVQAIALQGSRGRLRMAAHWTRRQFELGHDVIVMYQEAARTDPRVAVAWAEALVGRERALVLLVTSLEGDLRPGLGTSHALDILLTSTLPETYRSLIDRGWSGDEFEQWLGDLLVWELLGP
jgi:AcrR family transcriptional regulator